MMREADTFEVDDVPTWSLWLMAAICFGPITLVWCFGVLALPLWVTMVGLQLTQPEHFANEPEAIWSVVWAIAHVIAGGVGLAGVLRVLTLPRFRRPKSHRIFTIGMVVVGLATVLTFNLPISLEDVSDFLHGRNAAAFLVPLVLPFMGAAWLLAKSWRYLLAAPVRADVATRGSRTRGERRDDWRLDA